MKSNEPTNNNSNGQKPPPYPVEGSSMIEESPAPDPYTADLVSAVQYGYYDRVVELIESNSSLASTSTDDNITLLHWAAINNRIDIAQYLLNKGAPIDPFGGEIHSTPLHWAARSGKLQMVVFLLAHQAQVSLFDAEGFSSIHLAAVFGHTDVLAYLIAQGQSIDFPDKNGKTPLMHTAGEVRKRDPTQLLIQLGAQINLQNSQDGSTALHYAIQMNNYEAIRLLLDAGAKTDLPNSNNDTAYDLVTKNTKYRHLSNIISSFQKTNTDLPIWLRMNSESRRLGTKLLPYLVILFVALICQWNISVIFKIILFIALIMLCKGYSMIFFDHHIDRYLPIAIAQASIVWLYFCYFYYFLPYVHVFSFSFLFFIIFTYFSWSNYYWAQKSDPGFIRSSLDQQYRTIIQLVERNQFNSEHFCTSCLIRKPLRSKHCRDCHRCIAKFDHHCPWIDNCVGEKNLRYFVGFLFFTPLCLYLFLHGSYLFYRDHCHLLASPTVFNVFLQFISCSPTVLWFSIIAFIHSFWITALCGTILVQVAYGYTTNESMNSWRYSHMKGKRSSPFSLGCVQNLVDLIHRRILRYRPIDIDWSRIYSLDEFNQSISQQLRVQSYKSSGNSAIDLLNV